MHKVKDLSKGVTDKAGKHYRSRRWTKKGQTEGKILQELQDWLWEPMSGDKAAEVATTDSEDSD